MIDRLRELQEKHPIIGDVRGRGLMIGIELVRDRVTKERATAERDQVVDACFKRGLLVLGAGRNAIRLSPPLVLTKAQADTAVDISTPRSRNCSSTPVATNVQLSYLLHVRQPSGLSIAVRALATAVDRLDCRA